MKGRRRRVAVRDAADRREKRYHHRAVPAVAARRSSDVAAVSPSA